MATTFWNLDFFVFFCNGSVYRCRFVASLNPLSWGIYDAGRLVRSSGKSVLSIEITLKERTYRTNGLTGFDCILWLSRLEHWLSRRCPGFDSWTILVMTVWILWLQSCSPVTLEFFVFFCNGIISLEYRCRFVGSLNLAQWVRAPTITQTCRFT